MATLDNMFALKDLGKLNYFLGTQVQYLEHGFILNQSKYVDDMLQRICFSDLKSTASPNNLGKNLSINDGVPLTDPFLYRSTIGALQYITNTRLNITYMVNHISQFLKASTDAHWQATKRVLRYISGTKNYGLLFQPSHSLEVSAYSDVDWAANIDDRKLVVAYCVFVGGNLVSWSSKKQTAVARSSTESEYRALAHTTSEIIWL
ncbi:uncharacterized mitochondrial protein AtMg00810-like [Benincasa hispida]|uniref:uncharacterized mitochondrial protein AtMg00810-like n=1 Tax=Benincasa hispida TaxID=102211 RepID=UPI0019024C94|nr:uncharacterized mitochondrial protein AtMg00810-like [Benincasa hispida]